eukprot:COSAG05_NODE_801_length_7224_cov_4.552000_9_plen_73_part_00
MPVVHVCVVYMPVRVWHIQASAQDAISQKESELLAATAAAADERAKLEQAVGAAQVPNPIHPSTSHGTHRLY